jgi:hypothetical protein
VHRDRCDDRARVVAWEAMGPHQFPLAPSLLPGGSDLYRRRDWRIGKTT